MYDPAAEAAQPSIETDDEGDGYACLPVDRQWRRYGKGLLPLRPDPELEAWIEQELYEETKSGAPARVEIAWDVRRPSEAHETAWRMLLIMARTGWNLQWDILDAEQGEGPMTERQFLEGHQAPRQVNGLRVLRGNRGRAPGGEDRAPCVEVHKTRLAGVHATWLRINDLGRELLGFADIEPVESDWDRMERLHDPKGRQLRHTMQCLLAARLARGRGWQAELMPAEQPQIDLRLTPPGAEPIYVEVEARAPQRRFRRERKWQRLGRLQGFCAVITTRPRALLDLEREVHLTHRKRFVGTDLETLAQDPDIDFWLFDDRNPKDETPERQIVERAFAQREEAETLTRGLARVRARERGGWHGQ